MKRYSMQYESDVVVCGNNNHYFGNASTLNVAKGYISKCRKYCSDEHPRNFRIYDHFADVDEETGYVSCVYQED